MKAWGAAEGWERCKLAQNMRDMPDSFINQAFKGEARWTLRVRMEDYRKAVRQVLELGAMFSEDSEIRRRFGSVPSARFNQVECVPFGDACRI